MLHAPRAKDCAASAQAARELYAQTRELQLPRALLYVPGEKAPKGKPLPLGPISKRVAELRKKFPQLTPMQAATFELHALRALQSEAA